jgi:hypothetical protein
MAWRRRGIRSWKGEEWMYERETALPPMGCTFVCTSSQPWSATTLVTAAAVALLVVHEGVDGLPQQEAASSDSTSCYTVEPGQIVSAQGGVHLHHKHTPNRTMSGLSWSASPNLTSLPPASPRHHHNTRSRSRWLDCRFLPSPTFALKATRTALVGMHLL